MSDLINIALTREQALDLSSLLGVIAGTLQYQAVKTTGTAAATLTSEWEKWRAINKAVSVPAGFEAFLEHNRLWGFSIEPKYEV